MTPQTIVIMTYWADNIKFIKDCLDSKYKKIEDSLMDVSFYSLVRFQDKWSKMSNNNMLFAQL